MSISVKKGKHRKEKKRCAPIEAIHPMTGKTILVRHQRDIRIGHDLNEELRTLPGLLSWYLQLRDIAKSAAKDARHIEHNVEEDLSISVREEIEDEGRKPTETEIKTRVKAHHDMRVAFRGRMKAEARLQQLESAVQAMIEKKWILRSMVDLRKTENVDDSA